MLSLKKGKVPFIDRVKEKLGLLVVFSKSLFGIPVTQPISFHNTVCWGRNLEQQRVLLEPVGVRFSIEPNPKKAPDVCLRMTVQSCRFLDAEHKNKCKAAGLDNLGICKYCQDYPKHIDAVIILP